MKKTPALTELLRLFLKLGFIAFGGPAAHIALFEEEVVSRRRWLDREHFMDLIGATNLIPGPNSTEMAIHIGYIVRGWRGLLIAGCSFILPAALITTGIAHFYQRFGQLPEMEGFLTGIKAVVVVIILNAVIRLGRTALKNPSLTCIALLVSVLALLGGDQVLLILGGGLLGMVWLRRKELRWRSMSLLILPLPSLAVGTQISQLAQPSLWQIAFFFFKVGSVLFGSGYVLVAFLQSGIVRDHAWLSGQQLLDAVAAGQLTPGPILSTATFVGYLMHGWGGAAVATVAVFLPSFLFVLVLNPLVPKLRRSQWSAAFMDAVNASAVALMAAVVIELGKTSLHTWSNWLIAVAALIAMLRFRVAGPWLIIVGAILGFCFS